MKILDAIADWWSVYWPFFALAACFAVGGLCLVGAISQVVQGSLSGAVFNLCGVALWVWISMRILE